MYSNVVLCPCEWRLRNTLWPVLVLEASCYAYQFMPKSKFKKHSNGCYNESEIKCGYLLQRKPDKSAMIIKYSVTPHFRAFDGRTNHTAICPLEIRVDMVWTQWSNDEMNFQQTKRFETIGNVNAIVQVSSNESFATATFGPKPLSAFVPVFAFWESYNAKACMFERLQTIIYSSKAYWSERMKIYLWTMQLHFHPRWK